MSREYIEYIYELLDVAKRRDFFDLTSEEFNYFSAEVLEALEKQILRKADAEIAEIGGLQHICQSCWGFVGYLHEHCENCGQALDWSEE